MVEEKPEKENKEIIKINCKSNNNSNKCIEPLENKSQIKSERSERKNFKANLITFKRASKGDIESKINCLKKPDQTITMRNTTTSGNESSQNLTQDNKFASSIHSAMTNSLDTNEMKSYFKEQDTDSSLKIEIMPLSCRNVLNHDKTPFCSSKNTNSIGNLGNRKVENLFERFSSCTFIHNPNTHNESKGSDSNHSSHSLEFILMNNNITYNTANMNNNNTNTNTTNNCNENDINFHTIKDLLSKLNSLIQLSYPDVLVESPKSKIDEKSKLDQALKINNITYEIDSFSNEVSYFKDSILKNVKVDNLNKLSTLRSSLNQTNNTCQPERDKNMYEINSSSNKRINNYRSYFEICLKSLDSIKELVALQNQFNNPKDISSNSKMSRNSLNNIINQTIYTSSTGNFTQIGGILNIEQNMNVKMNANGSKKSDLINDTIQQACDISKLEKNNSNSNTNDNENENNETLLNTPISIINNDSCLINESAIHENIYINKPDNSTKNIHTNLEKIDENHSSKKPKKFNNELEPIENVEKMRVNTKCNNYDESNSCEGNNVFDMEFQPKESINRNSYNNDRRDSHSKKMTNL